MQDQDIAVILKSIQAEKALKTFSDCKIYPSLFQKISFLLTKFPDISLT